MPASWPLDGGIFPSTVEWPVWAKGSHYGQEHSFRPGSVGTSNSMLTWPTDQGMKEVSKIITVLLRWENFNSYVEIEKHSVVLFLEFSSPMTNWRREIIYLQCSWLTFSAWNVKWQSDSISTFYLQFKVQVNNSRVMSTVPIGYSNHPPSEGSRSLNPARPLKPESGYSILVRVRGKCSVCFNARWV